MTRRQISQATQKNYNRIIFQLKHEFLERFLSEPTVEIHPVILVQRLLEKQAELRPKSFLTYKSAIIWWLSLQEPHPQISEAQAFLQNNITKSGYKDEKGVAGAATLYSAKSSRPRTVSKKKLQKILDELTTRIDSAKNSRQSLRASELNYWLRAGIATGLRPIEWSTAEWEDRGEGILRVKTAKRKASYALPDIAHLQPPSFEQYRTVFLADLNDAIWVELHIKSVQQHLQRGGKFQKYYNNNRIYLYELCKAIFPAGEAPLTLYTLRGQFAANRKRSGQPRDDLGEEMGCSAHYTSTAYGSQIYGHKSVMPNSWQPKLGDESKLKPEELRSKYTG